MSPVRVDPLSNRDTSLLYRNLHGRDPEIVVGGEGAYLILEGGRRILDACSGAAVASIGHGDKRVIAAVTKQLTELSFHHTLRLTNHAAEKLAKVLVGHKPGGLCHAIFLSSGSEANESAIKLARQYHIEVGQPQRVHFISRLNSYHGNGIGCVSLTGIPSRREHFEPILMPHTSRVSACYPYRNKNQGETDAEYAQRLGEELEDEILRVGADRVAAFFAETVGGAAAGNLTPVPGYFKEIRRVCDKYGVLLCLDEIMCGMGRTGKLHAWEWEGIAPDIETCGKGLNGGYQPLSAVLISERVVEGLRQGSGQFANGQTYQCHPAAAAAGLAVMQVFETDDIVATCAKRGAELRAALIAAVGDHPNVGDIRGRGLFLSIEFVIDKNTKSTFPIDIPVASLMDDAVFRQGIQIYSGFGKGTADGVRGDHILFAPPLNITSEQVQFIAQATKNAVYEVFSSPLIVQVVEAGVEDYLA